MPKAGKDKLVILNWNIKKKTEKDSKQNGRCKSQWQQ